MRFRLPVLILALALGCGADGESSAEASSAPEPSTSPEPPPDDVPEGPSGYTRLARCGQLSPTPSVAESRSEEFVIRDRLTASNVTMQIGTAQIGWLCVFDQFGPGEARTPRGTEHITAPGMVWSEPTTRDFEEPPAIALPDTLFVLTEENVTDIQALQHRIYDATTDEDRSAACEAALAHRVETTEAAVEARVVPLLEGEGLITQSRPSRVGRAIDGILQRCRPSDPEE